MNRFVHLASGIDVMPVLGQLMAQPWLWNQRTERKTAPGTPHAAMSDIWVRYRAEAELTGPESFLQPHLSVMWPAWHALPALQPIVFGVMARVQATMLGGILITRIPPGGMIDPHHDLGSWHAEFYRTKVYVPLKSNARCVNVCEGEEVVMRVGEAWSFDNLVTHSVENNGATDRITAIICMKTE